MAMNTEYSYLRRLFVAKKKKLIRIAIVACLLLPPYFVIIHDGVRIPYYRSLDGTVTIYVNMNFGFLFPCLIGRIVVEPDYPGGRSFGKQYTFPEGYLEPQITDFGPRETPYRVPRTE